MIMKDVELMQYRENRIETFENGAIQSGKSKQKRYWTHSSPDIRHLADCGFYFTPTKLNHDQITCIGCKKKETNIGGVENIADHHLANNPNCPYSLLISSQIQYLTEPQKNYWENHAIEALREPLSKQAVAVRRKTFGSYWKFDKDRKNAKATSLALAKSGFYYCPLVLGNDRVQCVYCDCSLDTWLPDDNPVAEHRANAALECYFLRKYDEHKASSSRSSSRSRSRSRSTSRNNSVSFDSSQDVEDSKEMLDLKKAVKLKSETSINEQDAASLFTDQLDNKVEVVATQEAEKVTPEIDNQEYSSSNTKKAAKSSPILELTSTQNKRTKSFSKELLSDSISETSEEEHYSPDLDDHDYHETEHKDYKQDLQDLSRQAHPRRVTRLRAKAASTKGTDDANSASPELPTSEDIPTNFTRAHELEESHQKKNELLSEDEALPNITNNKSHTLRAKDEPSELQKPSVGSEVQILERDIDLSDEWNSNESNVINPNENNNISECVPVGEDKENDAIDKLQSTQDQDNEKDSKTAMALDNNDNNDNNNSDDNGYDDEDNSNIINDENTASSDQSTTNTNNDSDASYDDDGSVYEGSASEMNESAPKISSSGKKRTRGLNADDAAPTNNSNMSSYSFDEKMLDQVIQSPRKSKKVKLNKEGRSTSPPVHDSSNHNIGDYNEEAITYFESNINPLRKEIKLAPLVKPLKKNVEGKSDNTVRVESNKLKRKKFESGKKASLSNNILDMQSDDNDDNMFGVKDESLIFNIKNPLNQLDINAEQNEPNIITNTEDLSDIHEQNISNSSEKQVGLKEKSDVPENKPEAEKSTDVFLEHMPASVKKELDSAGHPEEKEIQPDASTSSKESNPTSIISDEKNSDTIRTTLLSRRNEFNEGRKSVESKISKIDPIVDFEEDAPISKGIISNEIPEIERQSSGAPTEDLTKTVAKEKTSKPSRESAGLSKKDLLDKISTLRYSDYVNDLEDMDRIALESNNIKRSKGPLAANNIQENQEFVAGNSPSSPRVHQERDLPRNLKNIASEDNDAPEEKEMAVTSPVKTISSPKTENSPLLRDLSASFQNLVESSTPEKHTLLGRDLQSHETEPVPSSNAKHSKISSAPVPEVSQVSKTSPSIFSKPSSLSGLLENLKNMEAASEYLSKSVNSPYDLHDDYDGELTNFISNMPEEEENMTIQQWIRHNAANCHKLASQTCQEMIDAYKEECQKAIEFLEQLPTTK